jgi:hypothetical protein
LKPFLGKASSFNTLLGSKVLDLSPSVATTVLLPKKIPRDDDSPPQTRSHHQDNRLSALESSIADLTHLVTKLLVPPVPSSMRTTSAPSSQLHRFLNSDKFDLDEGEDDEDDPEDEGGDYLGAGNAVSFAHKKSLKPSSLPAGNLNFHHDVTRTPSSALFRGSAPSDVDLLAQLKGFGLQSSSGFPSYPATATSWFSTSRTLANIWIASTKTYESDSFDLTAQNLLDMQYSPFGLFLVNICGTPHHFQRHQGKKTMSDPTCKIFNPDNHVDLAQLASQATSPYLLATTPAHLLRSIQDEMQASFLPTHLPFVQQSAQEKFQCLVDFQKLIMSLLDRIGLSGHLNGQSNRYHITTMALVTTFYVNRWMRAITKLDLSYLVEKFDSHWDARYEIKRLPPSGQSIPRQSLKLSLELLDYCCAKCGGRGAVHKVVCIKCDCCIKSPSPASVKGDKVGGSKTKPLNSTQYADFQSWKKQDANKGKSMAAYMTLKNIKGPTMMESSSATTTSTSQFSSASVLPYDLVASDQQLIPVHEYSSI